MSTVEETTTREHRNTLYIVVGVIAAVLMVVALLVYDEASDNAEAQDKADQLISALEEAGYTAPTQDQIVNVLGDDGGATCNDPSDNLNRAILYSQLTNGAAGPGLRPTVVDRRVVAGQLLIISIYCPDHLSDFQKVVADLKFGDVATD